MKSQAWAIAALSITIMWIAPFMNGCDESSSVDDVGDAGKKKNKEEDAGASDTDTDTDTDDDVCDEQDLALKLEGVKVMLLVDFSSSMNAAKWSAATEAIRQMVTDPANADTQFGLHLFPKPGMLPNCNASFTPAVMVGPDNGAKIVEWMETHSPGFFSMTPLVEAMRYYLGVVDTALHDPATANYIVVLSDGEDTCFGMDSIGDTVPYPFNTPNILAGITDDIKDLSGIKTFAIGFGNVNTTAKAQLNAIAKNGGTSFDRYIQAADGPALIEAFDEIAKSIRPCRYILESPEAEVNTSEINFYFDNDKVDRDRKHEDGWDWTKGDELEVEFFGQACERIKSGNIANVNATFGCPTQIDGETCAEFDTFLKFPGVATMFLQDVSGSMMTPYSKWKGASSAITNMLVDDRNNHVSFGFDAFPAGNSCEIAASPEISIGGPETRLMIVEWMTSNMPSLLGGTPLVSAMKRFINRPGGIERKDVSGVLIVISDGGDSCASSSLMSIPEQLSQVTEELVSRHNVRVFAIGYGGGANTAQLDAIAQAGGTGMNQHQNANDQADLEKIFKQISSMVTSCIFSVPYAGADADYENVNFYFDGDVVPRDMGGNNGWNWVNEVKKESVEFFGQYCDMLKQGEVTDVVVEFGCDTVILE